MTESGATILSLALRAGDATPRAVARPAGRMRAEPDGTYFGGNGHLTIADPGVENALTGDFTIEVDIRVDEPTPATIGDVLGAFDPVSRRGLSLGFSHGSVTTSHRNHRNLFFGWDAGTEPTWIDRGRPGDALFVTSLAVMGGELYAGTYEGGAEPVGRVYRLQGRDRWIDLEAPVRSNAVNALAVHGGRLFAGTARMKAGGSALPDSANQEPGGAVIAFHPTHGWTAVGQLGGADSVGAMAVVEDQLFATPAYDPGVYRFVEPHGWEEIGHPGRRLLSLGGYRGALYGAGNDHLHVDDAIAKTRSGVVVEARSRRGGGGVFKWQDGHAWRSLGMQRDTTQVYSMTTYGDRLVIGTWPNGLTFRYAGGSRWEDTGRLGAETEVMGMAVYNGKLYAGTLPHAEIYRFEADGDWAQLMRLDTTENALYRRAASMAVFQGGLWCGTLPSGHVWSMEAGVVASHDHAFGSGWHHVLATRERGSVSLLVDGALVGHRRVDGAAPAGSAPASAQPLTIGRGPQGHFTGWIRDLQIRAGAVAIDLSRQPRPVEVVPSNR
jgi:hypothetical protein